MKAGKTQLIGFMALLLLPISIHAQNSEVPISDSPTFLDIVFGGSLISIFIYLCLFMLFLAVLPLGITSIIQSFNKKRKGIPLSTKLLICGCTASFLFALLGIIVETITSFAAIAVHVGEACDKAVATSISSALYSSFIGIVCSLLFLFFISTSTIAFHVAHKGDES